jgi:hypothetical protein
MAVTFSLVVNSLRPITDWLVLGHIGDALSLIDGDDLRKISKCDRKNWVKQATTQRKGD